jgi:polysaccharide export outer membrane protein
LRMERELLLESAVQISTSVSSEEIAAKKVELEQKAKLIEAMRKVKATGRMTIKLAHLRILKGSEFDVELENGDSLLIPEKNSTVNVVGAVMAQGTYIYSEKMNYEDYINAMGGYSRYADKDNIFVLKADGSARKISMGFMDWNGSRTRWELAAFGDEVRQIEPGDVIVVPEKIERIAWLRELKDITQILMQIAVIAGVTINLF